MCVYTHITYTIVYMYIHIILLYYKHHHTWLLPAAAIYRYPSMMASCICVYIYIHVCVCLIYTILYYITYINNISPNPPPTHNNASASRPYVRVSVMSDALLFLKGKYLGRQPQRPTHAQLRGKLGVLPYVVYVVLGGVLEDRFG